MATYNRKCYKPEVNRAIDALANHAEHSFRNTPCAGRSWEDIITFESGKVDALFIQYHAFPDKRTSEAIHIRKTWAHRCARLHYFRIFAKEAVPVVAAEGDPTAP